MDPHIFLVDVPVMQTIMREQADASGAGAGERHPTSHWLGETHRPGHPIRAVVRYLWMAWVLRGQPEIEHLGL